MTTSTVGIRDHEVNVSGKESFTLMIPKSVFAEGAFTLYATHTRSGEEGLPSARLSITYDLTAPAINISKISPAPASSKQVSAVDEDDAAGGIATTTNWVYKQIKSGVVCGDDALKQDAQKYNEGKEITFKTEDDNNTKVCFSSTDLAGNVTYAVSDEIVGIDTKEPTIAKIMVTSDDTLTVTVSENVYSKTSPTIDDFVVFVNDEAATIESITGIQNTVGKARDQFTVTISGAFSVNDAVSLSYIQPTNSNLMIKDATDKPLAGFEKVTATLPPALSVVLDPTYDTGESNSDGLTSFGDGTDIGFVITLNKGVFKDGNKIRIYRNNERRALKTAVIGIRPNEVNARGEGSFTMMLPKSRFTEGSFTLRATYDAGTGTEGLPSTWIATSPYIRLDCTKYQHCEDHE